MSEGKTMFWVSAKTTQPPKDRPFWAWLYQTGIREMRWASPAECADYEGGDPDEYDGCYVEVGDFDQEWSPDYWADLNSIPRPLKEQSA